MQCDGKRKWRCSRTCQPAPHKATRINGQTSEEAGHQFEDDGGCLFALDSKVIVDAAAMTVLSSAITSGMQQYNNFVEERLEKRTKPIKKPLRTNNLHVFVQQQKDKRSSLTILRNGCTLERLQGKETCQNFQARKPATTTVIEQTG